MEGGEAESRKLEGVKGEIPVADRVTREHARTQAREMGCGVSFSCRSRRLRERLAIWSSAASEASPLQRRG